MPAVDHHRPGGLTWKEAVICASLHPADPKGGRIGPHHLQPATRLHGELAGLAALLAELVSIRNVPSASSRHPSSPTDVCGEACRCAWRRLGLQPSLPVQKSPGARSPPAITAVSTSSSRFLVRRGRAMCSSWTTRAEKPEPGVCWRPDRATGCTIGRHRRARRLGSASRHTRVARDRPSRCSAMEPTLPDRCDSIRRSPRRSRARASAHTWSQVTTSCSPTMTVSPSFLPTALMRCSKQPARSGTSNASRRRGSRPARHCVRRHRSMRTCPAVPTILRTRSANTCGKSAAQSRNDHAVDLERRAVQATPTRPGRPHRRARRSAVFAHTLSGKKEIRWITTTSATTTSTVN